jgi:flagellar protein FlgJ
MAAAATTQVNAAFALDAKALASLQATSRATPDKALKQAATQFEAVFMNMLLKSMRESIPQEGATDSEATRTYTGMLDQQMAQSLSGKGVGLADLIVKQLSRQMGVPANGKAAVGPVSGAATPLNTSNNVRAVLDRVRSGVSTAVSPETAPQAQDFVRNMLPHARAAEQATGIPARFILAQSALESGWGKSEVRGADGTQSRNLFGIKASKDWTGPVVEASTTEFVNGESRRVTQRFRAYSSYAESYADYAKLLTNNPRYRGVLAQGRDASGFANALQQAGYATDPRYAEKITRIIQANLGGTAV